MDKFTIEVDARTIYDSLKNLESKMEEMITHQKETNGRVTKNEKKVSAHDRAIYIATGIVISIQFATNIIF